MALKRVEVSVLMSLDAGDWSLRELEDAVDSVRQQEVPNWRLSVVDATHNDDAKALVKRMIPKDKLLWDQPWLSTHPSRASCLWQAAGGMKSLWAAYIDAGAVWSKDHLLRLLSVGRGYQIDVVFSSPPSPATEFWGRIPGFMRMGNFIDLASVIHTQGVYRAASGWRREQPTCADWDLWLQFADGGAQFGHVAVPTVERRRSLAPVVDPEEAVALRMRRAVKARPEFTKKELAFLAACEDDSAEDRIYCTKGER